jgi:hypothetical protein
MKKEIKKEKKRLKVLMQEKKMNEQRKILWKICVN